jgi:hypothetical protein
MCFTAADVSDDGLLLLGTGPFNADGPQAPGEVTFPLTAGHRFFNLGVQVWTRTPAWGRMTTSWSAIAAQPADWWQAATRTDGSADHAVFASAWVFAPESAAGGTTRRPLFVDMVLLEAGVRSFTLQSGVDEILGSRVIESSPTAQDPNQTATGTQEMAQLMKVFSATEAPATGANVARDGVWGTAQATNHRLVRVRRDLSTRVGSRRAMRVRLTTSPSSTPPATWLGVVGVDVAFGGSGVANPTGRPAGTGGSTP